MSVYTHKLIELNNKNFDTKIKYNINSCSYCERM